MPRKLTDAEDKPTLVPPPSRSLDEIILERTAGLPPERVTEEALRRTIIEVLMTEPDVPLTGMMRLFVAFQLERLLPKKEQAERERQRLLRSIEDRLVTAKWVRKWVRKHGRAARPSLPRRSPPRHDPTALEAVHEVIFRDPDDLSSRFPSPAALEQFLKRERGARKKHRKNLRRVKGHKF